MQFDQVITDATILGGKPILKGTRISVEFILELVASGASIQDILDHYPHLSQEAVRQAILFAAYRLHHDVEITVAA